MSKNKKLILVFILGIIFLTLINSLLGIRIEPLWKHIIHCTSYMLYGAIIWTIK